MGSNGFDWSEKRNALSINVIHSKIHNARVPYIKVGNSTRVFTNTLSGDTIIATVLIMFMVVHHTMKHRP